MHAVLRRRAPPRRRATRARSSTVADVRVDLARHEVTVAGQPVALTRKEFQILALLAAARRHGVSPAGGSSPRCGAAAGRAANRTLDVHVATLRTKLGRPELVATVRGVGYRLGVPDGRGRSAGGVGRARPAAGDRAGRRRPRRGRARRPARLDHRAGRPAGVLHAPADRHRLRRLARAAPADRRRGRRPRRAARPLPAGVRRVGARGRRRRDAVRPVDRRRAARREGAGAASTPRSPGGARSRRRCRCPGTTRRW